MSIILINTPVEYGLGFESQSGTQINPHLPLGLLQIATYLERNNVKCKILDLWISPLNEHDLIECVNEFMPSAIGLNATSPSLPTAWKLGRSLKRAFPDVPIICGGIHPTVSPMSVLGCNSPFDYIVIGRGELALRELLTGKMTVKRSGTPPCAITGHDRKPATSEYSPLNLDLGSIDIYLRQRREIPVLTAVGCTRACSYCAISKAWPHRIAEKNVLEVLNDINYYHSKYYVDRFIFETDNMCEHGCQYLRSLMRSFRKLHWQISWRGLMRLDSLDQSIIPEMQLSGCREILYGVDAVSTRGVAWSGRHCNKTSVLAAAKALRAAGIAQQAMFIIGFPDETLSDYIETVTYINQLVDHGVDEITVFPLYMYPGTKIWQQRDGISIFGAFPIIGMEISGLSGGMMNYLRRYPLLPEQSRAFDLDVGKLMVALSYVYAKIGSSYGACVRELSTYICDCSEQVTYINEYRDHVSSMAYQEIMSSQ